MIPAEIELSYEQFLNYARQMFPDADDATLEALYPMVKDLRTLAKRVSKIALAGDAHKLSETASGET
jgi:hypothetical protein